MKSLIAFILFGVIFTSCKKTETDATPYAALTIINASPTSATYDIYLGANKINTVALPLGGTIPYTQQLTGAFDVKVTTAGRAESLFTKTVNLTQNTYFSFYLVGKPTAFEGIFVSDDLSATSTTNAFVRFINLSPDAPALDLFINGGASVATKSTYKTIGSFVPITAGTYSFDVKDNATAAVKTSLTGVALVANGKYTIITRGLITPILTTELPISAQVIFTK